MHYKVACYPQSSGNFVSSRLDSLQLDIAHIGSTPWAQAVARGVAAKEIYISHYMGESQGIYVRPDDNALNYTGIVTPYDLRNKKVGVPFGSTTHYQLLFLIDLLGLKGTVEVIDMSPAGKYRQALVVPASLGSMTKVNTLSGDSQFTFSNQPFLVRYRNNQGVGCKPSAN